MHEGSKVIIVVVQVRAVKIYVAAEQWRRSGKRKEGMKLSLLPKLVEKLVWVPVISTKIGGKTSLGSSHFVQNWWKN
jgi:hypothetical protein